MKIKQLLYATVTVMILGAVAGCSDREDVAALETSGDDVMLSELKTVIPDTATTVSLERAMEIASAYKGTAPQSRSTVGRVVETVETVTDEDGEPLLYVVNYAANQGFVILSAKKDYYPVLAENDEGHFVIPQTSNEHPAYMWLDEQKSLLKHSAELPAEVRKEAAGQWMSFNTRCSDLSRELVSRAGDEKPQVYYDSLRKWSLDPDIEVYKYEDYINTEEYRMLSDEQKNYISSSLMYLGNSNYGTIESSTLVLRRSNSDSFKNQLLKTAWNQIDGFNKYVPGYDSYNSNYYPLGCSTIAAGQVMRYYEHPSNIEWSKMQNLVANDYSSKFLYELALKIRVNFQKNEGTATLENVVNALNDYGYKVNRISHNSNNVEAELKKSRPVIMKGHDNSISDGKHAWVCSGLFEQKSTTEISFMTIEYRPTTYYEPSEMIDAYHISNLNYWSTLFYMNWGQYDTKVNGYYSDNNITHTYDNGNTVNYQSNREDLLIQK